MAEQTQTLNTQTSTVVPSKPRGLASKKFQENLWITIATIIALIGLIAVLLCLSVAFHAPAQMQVSWVKNGGGSATEMGLDICADGQGNSYSTGYLYNELNSSPRLSSSTIRSSISHSLFFLPL